MRVYHFAHTTNGSRKVFGTGLAIRAAKKPLCIRTVTYNQANARMTDQGQGTDMDNDTGHSGVPGVRRPHFRHEMQSAQIQVGGAAVLEADAGADADADAEEEEDEAEAEAEGAGGREAAEYAGDRHFG